MKTKLIKELYWVLGVLVITFVMCLITFEGKLFSKTAIDISANDTYYVITKSLYLQITFFSLLTATYLVKGIYKNLNNKIINGLLTLLFISLLVVLIIQLSDVVKLEENANLLYSKETDIKIESGLVSPLRITKANFWTLILITGTLMATTVYKTFRTHEVQ